MEDQHSPPPLQMTVKDTNENLVYKIRHDYTDTLTNQKSQYIVFF